MSSKPQQRQGLASRWSPLGRSIGATVVVCAFSLSAQAQQPAQPVPQGADLRPAEVQQLFDAYVVMEAQDTLGLDNEQFAKWLPRLRALQQVKRQYEQQRQKIMAELQRLTNPRGAKPIDDTLVTAQLTALRDVEVKAQDELRTAYDALDAVLTVYQRARFRVFEQQVERRKLELLLRARQNRQTLRRQQQQ